MRNNTITVLVGACLGFVATTWVGAQEKKPEKKSAEQWAGMAAPGEEHKGLATLVGEWNVTFAFINGDKKIESKGKATYRSILGGRFIVEDFKVDLGQTPFEWMGVYGFDKQKKLFTATWYDNFDTSTETAEGTFDNDTKTLTLKGKHFNPGTDKLEDYKWTMKWEDENKTLRVKMTKIGDDGKEVSAVEIVQTKVK